MKTEIQFALLCHSGAGRNPVLDSIHSRPSGNDNQTSLAGPMSRADKAGTSRRAIKKFKPIFPHKREERQGYSAGYGLKTRLYWREIICEEHAVLYQILLALLLLTQLPVAGTRDLTGTEVRQLKEIAAAVEVARVTIFVPKKYQGEELRVDCRRSCRASNQIYAVNEAECQNQCLLASGQQGVYSSCTPANARVE